MKRFLMATAFSLAASYAGAADLAYKAAPQPAPVPYSSWTGFYIGLNGGYGGNNESQSIAGANPLSVTVVGTGIVPAALKVVPNGWVFGGQAGYNYQMGIFVMGGEADLQWANISGSATQLLTTAPLNLRGLSASLTSMGSSNVDWYGTVRGRIGFLPVSSLLVYATGGLAYGQINDNTSIALAVSNKGVPINGLNATALDSNNTTKFGWVVGGGFEYALNRNWSVKTEYQYINFGSHTDTFGATVANAPVLFTVNQKDDLHIAKVGVNYRW